MPIAIRGSCTMPAPTVIPNTVNSATPRPCPIPRAITSMLSGPGGICIRATVPRNAIQSAELMTVSSNVYIGVRALIAPVNEVVVAIQS